MIIFNARLTGKKTIFTLFILLSLKAFSATLPFDLHITGTQFDVGKKLKLSDIGEGKTQINFDFYDKKNNPYNFDLKYKKLPANRSYPTNLDITIKDKNGNKLGYLFFANNGVKFLKELGVFGLIVNINGSPVDFKFVFNDKQSGRFGVQSLTQERLIQDTLVPKFGFQMIRPIIAPMIDKNTLSQTYKLDNHPYAVNYTLKNIANGLVQFQHNLYQIKRGDQQLLERVYFNANSLQTLREAMYASKYFHPQDGTFKLVFYPAAGQIEPNK